LHILPKYVTGETNMKTLTIKPNKNGTKRIRIGNFIIRFDNTCITGNEHLCVLKDSKELDLMRAVGMDAKKPITDWLISIWETERN